MAPSERRKPSRSSSEPQPVKRELGPRVKAAVDTPSLIDRRVAKAIAGLVASFVEAGVRALAGNFENA